MQPAGRPQLSFPLSTCCQGPIPLTHHQICSNQAAQVKRICSKQAQRMLAWCCRCQIATWPQNLAIAFFDLALARTPKTYSLSKITTTYLRTPPGDVRGLGGVPVSGRLGSGRTRRLELADADAGRWTAFCASFVFAALLPVPFLFSPSARRTYACLRPSLTFPAVVHCSAHPLFPMYACLSGSSRCPCQLRRHACASGPAPKRCKEWMCFLVNSG